MGKDISNCCYPKSIKMSQSSRSGTLILSVKRGNEINVEYSKKRDYRQSQWLFWLQINW